MNSIFETREIAVKDISSLTSMMKDFYEIDGYPFDEKLAKNNFQKLIANPDLGKGFLVLTNGEVAGYILVMNYFSFEFGGAIWFLDELYIDSKFQGKSLGKKALDFVKNKAQEMQIPVILLEVENHNDRAISLYQKFGFQKHKRNLMILKD